MKAVMYGAGNIGRGFIGQLMSQSGYQVAFVDVNMQVIDALNARGEYPVEILENDGGSEVIVKNVSGVNGMDVDAVASAIADADVMATAVGVNILPRIVGNIAKGLQARWARGNKAPFNIIICENLIGADTFLRNAIKEQLSAEEQRLVDETIGFVEASIGRMVPIQTPEMTKGDVLRVCVEKFCTLIVDRDAFRGDIPPIQNMEAHAPFQLYIERKLYIHNSLKVTGYAGTVNAVNAKPNQYVYATTTLFTLKETSTSASYDALLRSRSEKEETLLELLQIQRNSGLTAPIAGSVYSVADLDDEDAEEEITDIVVLSPDISMSVTISVDESDILALELDQQADITVSAVSDETLSGVVTEIDKTDSSGAYTAVITLDKLEGMLPGMTASVDVRIEGVDDAILIPADALHQTSSGYYVYTSYDEETQEYGGKVDVVPGLSNSNYVEIKSGLNEGDTVYYTEKESFTNPFGGGFGGGSGGGMPSFGGGSGGGGGMPGGGGSMPSGGMPGGRG